MGSLDIQYVQFLERKAQVDSFDGFEPEFMPSALFDFQHSLVEWAVRKGRSAVFADCGMGKSLMQLVWAENVLRRTGKPVLVITPLAVSGQLVSEADKFGIGAIRPENGKPRSGIINVTNYERLHHFSPSDFGGMVCDESSILKSFDGARKQEITEFMRKMRYRLLCTATAAPNDYIELGTSSEALGYLGHMDMLNRFFKNDQNNSATGRAYGKKTQWRFKGHAEDQFWRWVCSWARAVRKPSDLGFDDGPLILPELIEVENVIEGLPVPTNAIVGLKELREETRRTLVERCEKAAEIVSGTGQPFISWCHLNPEGDLLEDLLPDAVQVSGSDSDEAKEEKFLAFASGQARGLITKTKIGAWGLNFQHCGHQTYFPDHSYEQYYQGVRRSWRFGRKDPVRIDVITTPALAGVLANLKRKSAQADRMFDRLVAHMRNEISIQRSNPFTKQVEVPSWL